jgi:secreted PhoX family phosphatase
MTSRKQTRARPTPRRQIKRAYTELFGGLLSRRALLRGSASAALAAGAGRLLPQPALAAEAASSLTFAELTRVKDDRDHWPDGYDRQILIRWGDPLVGSASGDFDPAHLTGEEQAKRFGYNNDFIAYIPLGEGEAASAHGLLVVNHEYAAPYLMWPGLTDEDYREKLSDEQIRAVKAAVGIAVLEVRKAGNVWELVTGKYNRRITLDTPIALSGPCAGHARMKTKPDPDGRTVLGTMPNCNGGLTPWDTVLSGEEGAMDFFSGDYSVLPDQELVERQGWDEDENDEYALGRIEARFRFAEEPNEWNRFDWVVELDPLEPESKPVKRTALGRFTHEGAQVVLNHDGRVVIFMGDDDDFEYLYRFVTTGTYDPANRAANKDLLDAGVLSAARFSENGGLAWLPLVFGQGPLTAANGFTDQAEVLFRTRQAADLLGATPMDGPEGFIPNLATGRIYVAMTENEDRLPAGEGEEGEQVNIANPRGPNPDGHLLELIPPRDGERIDWASESYDWDVFVLCGDPSDASQKTLTNPATSANGWFTDPDNLSADPQGRLWVCTDGPPPNGYADAVYAMDTQGPGKALSKLFYIPPVGSECCSPAFTPDGRTVFISVQHPGELRLDGEDAASLADMNTAWPDFQPGVPARPSVVVLSRRDGGVVGS